MLTISKKVVGFKYLRAGAIAGAGPARDCDSTYESKEVVFTALLNWSWLNMTSNLRCLLIQQINMM